ncbi:MAG: hypothetical protein U5N55_12710 [Cypionkella sp.]|nr:hypothetical protein [Cypionkella sp.]
MTIPVVQAANGQGIPVVNTLLGAPAIVATNGLGTPIVIVLANGTPMNVQGAV